MTRSILFLAAGALLAFASATAVADPALQHGSPRPNVLVFMTEDMSARVGAFGDDVASTPNLDALAASGVRFPNTFTTAGVCAPSRAAHITGMYQIAFGAQHMRTSWYKESPYRAAPPTEVKAYPELLRHAGYYTFTNRKLDYQFSSPGVGSGPFTIWDHEGAEPDWSGRRAGQPFYGLVNIPATHESQMFTENVKKNRAAGRGQLTDRSAVSIPGYYPDTPVVREYIARHYDNIAAADAFVGRILERLERDGLADSTIVIWTTDHGDGLPRGKREIYDSGIRVPMIIHWPEQFRPDWVTAGTEDQRLVSFVDFAPSILQLAGVEVPSWLQGKPVLFEATKTRAYVYAAKDRLDEFEFRERAVRDQRYKYIRNYLPGRPGATHLAYRDRLGIMQELWEYLEEDRLTPAQRQWFEDRPAEELYDTWQDPDELTNLAGDPEYAGTLSRLRDALNEWLARTGDRAEQPEADMAREFWPGGEQPVTPAPVITANGQGAVTIEPAVAGASIGYRVDAGPWQAYAPGTRLEIPAGAVLRAKSVRYGWAESPEISREF
jgi:arylsulfatase A-like enzyme